jgi:hypothetical protein
MIRFRLAAFGLLACAFGWQQLFAEIVVGRTIYGLLLLLFGIAMTSLALPTPAGRQQARWALGVLLGLATCLVALFVMEFLARIKEVWLVPEALAAGLRLLGVNAGTYGSDVVFHDGNLLVRYNPSLAKAGAFPMLIFMGGTALLLLVLPVHRLWRRLATTWMSVIGYTLLRLFLLTAARGGLPQQGIETSSALMMLSFLPLLALLPTTLVLAEPAVPRRQGRWLSVAGAGAAAFAAILVLAWEDPGRAKAGHILIDDSHGRWEPTNLPFDETAFGRQSAYSYGNVFDVLTRRYGSVHAVQEKLTAARLVACDVLIIKTPTTPFEPEEIQAIIDFVHTGGGLFLIGDHTNLFGMSTFLNQVAHHFGIDFRNDDTFALANEGPTIWRPWPVLRHSTMQSVGAFEFETSSSLSVPWRAAAPIIGYALGVEDADLSRPGFFGDIHLGPEDDLGFIVQFAVLQVGKGRVAALSDSTPFSNFSLFFPGRKELLLAAVAYVNRQATVLHHVPWLALALLVFGLALMSYGGLGQLPAMAMAAIVGVGLGVVVVQAARPDLTTPPPRTHVPRIVFDRAKSNANFPSSLLLDSSLDATGFDTFFVASQRLHYEPELTENAFAHLADTDLVILINPFRSLSAAEHHALRRFLTLGGSLLVIDSIVNARSTANEILAPFGIQLFQSFQYANLDRVVPSQETRMLSLSRPYKYVQGGNPVLLDSEGNVFYAEVTFGGGTVGVVAEGATFNRHALGNRFFHRPTQTQIMSYNTAFTIFRRLVEKGQ